MVIKNNKKGTLFPDMINEISIRENKNKQIEDKIILFLILL